MQGSHLSHTIQHMAGEPSHRGIVSCSENINAGYFRGVEGRLANLPWANSITIRIVEENAKAHPTSLHRLLEPMNMKMVRTTILTRLLHFGQQGRRQVDDDCRLIPQPAWFSTFCRPPPRCFQVLHSQSSCVTGGMFSGAFRCRMVLIAALG
jgi:hypothetical protein